MHHTPVKNCVAASTSKTINSTINLPLNTIIPTNKIPKKVLRNKNFNFAEEDEGNLQIIYKSILLCYLTEIYTVCKREKEISCVYANFVKLNTKVLYHFENNHVKF